MVELMGRPQRMVSASALLVSGIVFAACGGSEQGAGARSGDVAAWSGSVDTLPQGAVVVTSPAVGQWAPGEEWRLVEDVRIGSLDSDGPSLLGRVTDLAVDDLGRVWIAEGQAMEVRVFGPDGRFVRTVGRRGEGPGEFSEGPALNWGPRGRLWALDQGLGRFSQFDTAGTYLGAVPRQSTSRSYPWRGTILGDGSQVDVATRVDGQSFTTVLVHRDSAGAVLDTLDLPDQPPGWVVTSNGGSTRWAVPHGPVLVWSLDSQGALWFGVSDSLRVMRRILLGGDTTLIIRKEFESLAVSTAEKDSAMTVVEAVRSRGGDVRRADLPDVKPAFTHFEVDLEGRLWVMPILADETLAGRAFDVFDPDGRYLGRVVSESRLRAPFAFGDGVLWATTRDELDVTSVVRLRIEEGGGRAP